MRILKCTEKSEILKDNGFIGPFDKSLIKWQKRLEYGYLIVNSQDIYGLETKTTLSYDMQDVKPLLDALNLKYEHTLT